MSQYARHQRVLEAMALRRPLADVLTHLVDAIEAAVPRSLGSILLMDDSGTRLLHGAAPSLPVSYSNALHGMRFGASAGSCGTAAFRRERVIVEDIETDPLWNDYRALALPHGLRACWSTPILERNGTVLGTFAVYSRERFVPSSDDIRVVEELTSLASVAIQQARAESNLARREAYYRTLVNNAPTVILSMDGSGRIVDGNPAALLLFQRSREALIGRSLTALCADEARDRLSAWILAAQRSPTPLMCDVPVLDAAGQTRWLLFSLACAASSDALHDAALLAIGQDITARIESESEMRRTERQLRDTQKMEAVSRLAGGIAHDFNNLLTVIQGNAALALQRDHRDPELRVALMDVEGAAQRAATLTRQLLAFSHRDTMPIEVVDLGVLLSGVHVAMMSSLSDRVALRLTATDVALPVRVARAAVEEALTSIMLSARDAMPDGGLLDVRLASVTLDAVAATRAGVEAGMYAELQIRDSGPPMDDDARARAFEPFGAPPTQGRRGGMGLATLYALATRLHGTLQLESTAERGTLVTLLLPLAIAPTATQNAVTDFASPIAGLTILVVEDEDAVRNLMRRVLVGGGYRVITATDGEDAMAVWHRHGDEIDLVVTDVVMPRMTGPQLLARLRADRPDLPVVICSGYSDAMSSDVPTDDPYSTYLSKPFTLRALASAVARVDAASRHATAPPAADRTTTELEMADRDRGKILR